MNLKKLLLMLLTVFVGGTLFATGVAEEDALEPLVVGMELQFPPFEYSSPDGEPTGVSVDLARAFGEYLGRPVEIRNIEWTGLIPALRTGSVDVVISSMTITDERDEQIDFSIPYAQAGLTLLVNADSPVEDESDLNRDDVVLAVKSGTTGAITAQEKFPDAEIRVFDTVSACVLEVSQGKADAFIYDALTVHANWQNNPETTRPIFESIEGTFSYWGAGIPEGSPLKNDLDAFIREYRRSGGFDRLAEKYLEEIKVVFDEEGIPFFFDVDE
ncbi:MAG: transporter substrate-binding domain-containing protein [Alkalispirochaeta sp.]